MAATAPETSNEDKVTQFFDWLSTTLGATHVNAFKENEMTEWAFLLDSDAVNEILDDEGLGGGSDIIEKIQQIDSGVTPGADAIEDGKAAMLHDWLQTNFATNGYSEMLVAEGFCDWDSLNELDEPTLKECGIKKVGHRKKIFREFQRIRDAVVDEPGSCFVEESTTPEGVEAVCQDVSDSNPEAMRSLNVNAQPIKLKVVIRGENRKIILRSGDPMSEIQQIFHVSDTQRMYFVDSEDEELTVQSAQDIRDASLKKRPIYIAEDESPTNDAVEEKELDSSQRRPCIFDLRPNEPKKDIGIVLLGQTGAGKSTFKQALFDFAMGTNFEGIRETERNAEVKEGESQTKDVTVYEVEGGDFVLRIVDTPGIGDTEGLARDQEHVDNITQFLAQDCVINAICVLLPNGQCRAVAAMGYIINEIKTNLTHDLWPHVFTVVTRCAIDRFPGTDTCANIRKFGLPDASKEMRFFRVDNYAYELVDENMKYPGYLDAKQLAYTNGREQLHRIIEAAGAMEQKTGETIGELRQYRYDCKEKAKALSVECENILEIEQGIINTEKQLMNARSLQDMHRKFEEEHTIMKQEAREMPDGGKATICQYPKCNSRCHDPCYVRTIGDITGCCAFNGMSCTKCPHNRQVHQHTQTYFVEVPVTQKRVDEESKRKFLAAKNAEEAKKLVRQEFELKLRECYDQRQQLGREIGRLNALITRLAVINYNEYFPIYVDELIADIKRSPKESGQKKREIEALRQQLQEYERSKRMLDNEISGGGSQLQVAKQVKKSGVVGSVVSFIGGLNPFK